MVKRNNRHGFTIAELLIVVAIIAVLVAIAIPVFGNILENSREATDAANIRSSYAEAVALLLAKTGSEQKAMDGSDNNKIVCATQPYTIQQQEEGWKTQPEWTGPLSDFFKDYKDEEEGKISAGNKKIVVGVYMDDGKVKVKQIHN